MPNSLSLWSKIRTRIRSGPFGHLVEPYVALLQSQGYSPRVVRAHVRGVDQFGRWLRRHGISAGTIDQAAVDRFAARHRRRRSPSRPGGRGSEVVGCVRNFIAFLRERGVILRSTAVAPVTAKGLLLLSFGGHLECEKGLGPGTRHRYLRYAEAFVDQMFGDATPDWARVGADDIAEFVRVQAARLAPSGCRLPVTATRAFVRYLVLSGAVRECLTGSIPPIRQWKHASLPGAVSTADVERVLACCAEKTPTRLRDRAILLVLARLGLRASEVADLRLEDVDWRHGRLTVRAGKSGRPRVLPLPHDVGMALVSCVRAQRSGEQPRTVFRRSLPPWGPLSGAAVSCVAARALRRAGVTAPHFGSHVFRHTAATGMVRRGASFQEVADILGHARLDTTAIYAKLDLDTLRGVALPWPGGA